MNLRSVRRLSIMQWIACAAVLVCAGMAHSDDDRHQGRDDNRSPKTLYIWSGSQVPSVSAFLAVINFDEDSREYGEVIKTVPVPPPWDLGNEPHHCHLSADKNILACGGLLSVLRGQDGIFFFDVSSPRDPKYLFSTRAHFSSITDDFLPLEHGGFLITQMGSEIGASQGGWPNSIPT